MRRARNANARQLERLVGLALLAYVWSLMAYTPSECDSPFLRLGGADPVRRLVTRFYDQMDATESALAQLHELDAEGHVSPRARENFVLFFIEWLGGPRDYSATRGHPRLRMRHARVHIGEQMRDAWLRAMSAAMDDEGIQGDVRAFLDVRLSEVANFLRNVPE